MSSLALKLLTNKLQTEVGSKRRRKDQDKDQDSALKPIFKNSALANNGPLQSVLRRQMHRPHRES